LGVCSARRLISECGGEDDLGVFAGFKGELVYIVGEKVEKVFLYDEGKQLMH
jgi:hypothetical protein